MGYTPRQIEAWLFIARRRRKAEMADQLQLQAMASQGGSREINDQAKRLRDE